MQVDELPIKFDAEELARFCRTHGIRKLSLFGSVLREDFEADKSDLDVIVEFLPGKQPGWEFFRWNEELAALMDHKVDLHTPNSLSKYFRDEALRDSLTLYEQA